MFPILYNGPRPNRAVGPVTDLALDEQIAIPAKQFEFPQNKGQRVEGALLDQSSGASTASSTIFDSGRTIDISQFVSSVGHIAINEDDAPAASSIRPQESSPKFKNEASVSFDHVSIREYPRILGDHPDVGLGPPITISWEYCDVDTLSLDDYESNRGPRKSKIQLRLHPNTRKRMMLNTGATKKEIEVATKAANKAQRQRVSSNAIQECAFVCAIMSTIQSAKRKIKRRSWRSTSASI